jgi:hypothetical protein
VWLIVAASLHLAAPAAPMPSSLEASNTPTKGGAAASVGSADEPAISPSARQAWAELRRTRRLHLQTIATCALEDGGTTVIVTEPPPHVSAASAKAFLGARALQILSTPMGHDGHVSDIVLELPAQSPEELEERLTSLSSYLFGSAQGDYVLSLPVAPLATRANADLDLSVGAEDLRRWLFDERLALRPEFGGATTTAQELSATTAEGLFVSEPGGLVVWAVPHGADLGQHALECRRWSLRSDLVLGGVAGDKSVLIVGRERVLPVDQFPPLRVEEVLRLATVAASELQQSYERNHPLAGRFAPERRDWAPILLSAELIDTEFGSLLNITDQLLKSWSESGAIEYENFDYPAPSKYPFDKPLSALLEASTLTFNWNTGGVGYEIAWPDGVRVFALHRTGALPVTYIPSGADELSAAALEAARTSEDKAYGWFAASGDVHLARVVQYTALFQLFRAFDVRAQRFVAPSTPSASQKLLRDAVKQALTRIKESDDNALDQLGRAAAARWISLVEASANAEERRSVELLCYFGCTSCALSLREDLRATVTELGDKYLDALANLLAAGRADEATIRAVQKLMASYSNSGDEETLENRLKALPAFERRRAHAWVVFEYITGTQSECKTLLQHLTNIDDLKGRFAEEFQKRPETWVRTPSIVVSWNTRNVSAVGGHSIDPTRTKVIVDRARAPGDAAFEKAGQGWVVRAHPDEAAAMRGATRGINRATTDAGRRAALLDAQMELERLGKRSLKDALRLASGGKGPPPRPPHTLRLGASSADEHGAAGRYLRYVDDADGARVVVSDDAIGVGKARVFRARSRAGISSAIFDMLQRQLRNKSGFVDIELPRAWNDGEVHGLLAALRARTPHTTSIRVWQGRRELGRVKLDLGKTQLREVHSEAPLRALEGAAETLDDSLEPLRIRIELRTNSATTDVEALGRKALERFGPGSTPTVEQILTPLRDSFLKDPETRDWLLKLEGGWRQKGKPAELSSITITDASTIHEAPSSGPLPRAAA